MRKIVAFALLTAIVFSIVPISAVHSQDTADLTPSKVLDLINKDMREMYFKSYGEGFNYYPERTSKGPYRQDLLQGRIQAGKENGKYHFEIVYGSDHGTWLNHGSGMYEYSGYNLNGDSVATEGSPWFAGWSGRKIQDFNMIRQPWQDPEVQRRYGIIKGHFDSYSDSGNPHLKDGTFEHSIITGLNYEYAGKQYKNFMYQNKNAAYADRVVYDRNAKPDKGGDWIDYVHVIQPPTQLSWGMGTVYISNRSGNITYLDIPIAPFALQNDFADLSANFEVLPSGAAAGRPVTVGIRVKSTFQNTVTPSFSWEISNVSNGRRLNNSDDGLTFSGHAAAGSGKLNIDNNNEALLYATFAMPQSDVRIKFEVNGDGNEPRETILDNNVLNSQPLAVQLVQPVPLDYHVLSRKVRFPLAYGTDITAQLHLPKGNWTGNATGSLQVINETDDLFRPFNVTDNDPVNEAASTIVRKPIIHSAIHRRDFGDDPQNRRYLDWPNPLNPKSRDGYVSYNGKVSRNWEHTYTDCDADGDCREVTETGTATADFDSGRDMKMFDVYVYNGLENVPEPVFKQSIDNNSLSSSRKQMFWKNEPYPYNVIRWMTHLDEDGQPYDWVAVDGRYPRDFTQQASADIKWEAKRSMEQEYSQARSAARKSTNKKSLYDKAVFATDRELQKYDYPVKSGYYLNPTGTYSFTVETVTYKPTTEDTKDHKDLVNALIDSFRYETDLMYINSNREAVNLRDEPLAKSGGGYARRPAVLTADNNKGVDGAELLTVMDRSDDASRYSKKVEEIYHSQESTGPTHEYWKKVLEGYGESKTQGSYDYYKYREYVKDGQYMYRITEKTLVTIVINKDNRNVYTHGNMPNGDYYVRAWLADTSLAGGNHAYKTLGTLRGMTSLDNIKVTVQGSMYDDLNN